MKRVFKIGEADGFIAHSGKSEYKIRLLPEAGEAEHYAAEELARIVNMASGAEMDITYENFSPAIHIGCGKKPQITEVTRNGFVIKTIGRDVYIDAPNTSGLIYGVYRLMELVAGYMYYAPDETAIGESVEFRQLEILDFPDFLNRDIYNFDTKEFPDNAMRLYTTGSNYSAWAPKYGEGSWWSSLHDQSLCFQLLDWRIYREKFPDWYYGKYDGDPINFRPQLCYTRVLYDRDKFEKGDWSEENYNDGRHGSFWTLVYNLVNNYIAVEKDKSLFQLGMSDNYEFCDCEQCRKDVEKYSRSGVSLRLANAIADEVEKWRLENCPERQIYLTMFAYACIVNPPTKIVDGKHVPLDESVIARDNLLIRYAPIGDYYMFPLLDKEHNPGAYNALMGWSTVAKHFAVWDYRVDFGSLIAPFPQWMAAAENIRTYYKFGFVDVFYQGCRTSGGTPFIAMDNWVRSRMSWDTSLDYDKLTDTFIDFYYGEGGDCIREYRAFLTNHYLQLFERFGYKGHSHFAVCKRKYFPHECIEAIEEIFARGYKKIEALKNINPERYEKLIRRLDGESLFYRFMKIAAYPEKYSESERIQEIENFEKMSRAAKLKVVYDTFGNINDVIRTLKMQFED